MTKLLICSLQVLLLATLSGSSVEAYRGQYQDPNPGCCPPPCVGYGCPPPCVGYRCKPCWRLPVCGRADPPPAPVDNYDGYSLFVFGDSFADTGNLPKDSRNDLERKLYRSQHNPYGNSYGNNDGSVSSEPQATGRFSNYMVQSDFVARMLGLDMAPRPYKQQGQSSFDDTGMTFATGGSGVFPVPVQGVPTLSEQVDLFQTLVRSKISPERLAKFVALVAVSGNDYDRVGVALPKDFGGVSAFTLNVTSNIASSVQRLRGLGVPKVLVNNLQPVGCAPSQTKANKYSECDGVGNTTAETHNKNLASLLEGQKDKDGVLIVDLHAAFKAIIHGGTELSRRFRHKYTPYCDAIEDGEFCGDTGDDGKLYAFGEGDLKKYFYWDDMHPTQTGWAAVMEHVEGSINEFVGVA